MTRTIERLDETQARAAVFKTASPRSGGGVLFCCQPLRPTSSSPTASTACLPRAPSPRRSPSALTARERIITQWYAGLHGCKSVSLHPTATSLSQAVSSPRPPCLLPSLLQSFHLYVCFLSPFFHPLSLTLLFDNVI